MHLLVAFGQFASSPRTFYQFRIFHLMFQSWYWPSIGKTGSHAATDEELDVFHATEKKYFTDRVVEIRESMIASGNFVDSEGKFDKGWDKLLNVKFVGWLVDVDNPLRRLGDIAAHKAEIQKVISSFESLMSDIPVMNDFWTLLLNMRTVYPSAVANIRHPRSRRSLK